MMRLSNYFAFLSKYYKHYVYMWGTIFLIDMLSGGLDSLVLGQQKAQFKLQ